MTTIALRDGIMAADTRAWAGTAMPIGHKAKIHRLPDGGMIGVSTTQPGLSEMVAIWAMNEFHPDHEPHMNQHANLAILHVDGAGHVFFASDSLNFTGPLDVDCIAIGSGEHYALGAMAMGASAEMAVETAALLDAWTEGPIQTLEFEGEMPPVLEIAS